MAKGYFGVSGGNQLSEDELDLIKSVLPPGVVARQWLNGKGRWVRWFECEDHGNDETNDAIAEKTRVAVESSGVAW